MFCNPVNICNFIVFSGYIFIYFFYISDVQKSCSAVFSNVLKNSRPLQFNKKKHACNLSEIFVKCEFFVSVSHFLLIWSLCKFIVRAQTKVAIYSNLPFLCPIFRDYQSNIIVTKKFEKKRIGTNLKFRNFN